MGLPPLKPLHPDNTLIPLKLEKFRRVTTAELLKSLLPGYPDSLKVRPDGTVLDGHYRLKILRERKIDVDSLPREVIPKE